eukprot:scaffold215824_cov58-Attheya_sp.AAC.1
MADKTSQIKQLLEKTATIQVPQSLFEAVDGDRILPENGTLNNAKAVYFWHVVSNDELVVGLVLICMLQQMYKLLRWAFLELHNILWYSNELLAAGDDPNSTSDTFTNYSKMRIAWICSRCDGGMEKKDIQDAVMVQANQHLTTAEGEEDFFDAQKFDDVYFVRVERICDAFDFFPTVVVG